MIVLCGNKTDLDRYLQIIILREVSTSEGEKFAKNEGLLFFEISAKNNINIKKMFFSSLTELNFFKQFDLPKETIIKELDDENKELNMTLDESSIGNIPQINLKDTNKVNNGKCNQC